MRRLFPSIAIAGLICLGLCLGCLPLAAVSRLTPQAYIRMPDHSGGSLPPLLSQTGAFQNTEEMIAGDGLIPYDLNVSFWSDGARNVRSGHQ